MTTPRPNLPFPTIRSGLPLSAPLDWIRAGMEDLRACLEYAAALAAEEVILADA